MLRSAVLDSAFGIAVNYKIRAIIGFLLLTFGAAASLAEVDSEDPYGDISKNTGETLSASKELAEKAFNEATMPISTEHQRLVDDAVNATNKSVVGGSVSTNNIIPFDQLLFENIRPLQSGLIQHMPGQISSSDRFGISDEDMADARLAAMKEFGIDHGVNGYILVSRSMPDSLIRAYALDATRLGFTVAVKGMPESHTDILKYLASLGDEFHTTSSTMSIQIDPRLFDVFNVEIVPQIVLTSRNSNDLCSAEVVDNFSYKDELLPLRRCKPLPESEYCKISGAVFTDWAIEKMAEEGCKLALPFANENSTSGRQIEIAKDDWNRMTSELFSEMETGIYNEVLLETLEDPPFK